MTLRWGGREHRDAKEKEGVEGGRRERGKEEKEEGEGGRRERGKEEKEEGEGDRASLTSATPGWQSRYHSRSRSRTPGHKR